MTKLEFEKKSIALTVLNCSPVCAANPETGKNYNDFTFNELCELIRYYKLLIKDYPNNAIIAWTTLKDRGSALAYWNYDNLEPYYTGTGKLHIKALKINKHRCNTGVQIEYDDFLYNYIYSKFNYDINYIKSYIKINNFEL